MANFRITPTTSVLTTGNYAHAFTSDTPGEDSLLVDANAYLQTEGIAARSAFFANTKAWKVTVNGSIVSKQSDAILFGAGNAVSSLSIGASGIVDSDGILGSGIVAYSGVNIVNAGTIDASRSGVAFGGAASHNIKNTGVIRGGTYSVEDIDGLSADSITNSGTLYGAVSLNGGNDVVTNTGLIANIVITGNGNDTLKNTNDIGATIYLGDGDDKVTNSGRTADSIFCEEGNDTVTNSGRVGDKVSLGNGLNKLTNAGTIGGNVSGGDGQDIVKNTGLIGGAVNLGGGDDIYTGSNFIDTVVNSAGSDTIKLGGDNDTYIATSAFSSILDRNDSIDGGAGIDTYEATVATQPLHINLDKTPHNLSPFDPGAGFMAAHTAAGYDIGGLATDTVRNFENIRSGGGNDILYGSAVNNSIEGGDGQDWLFGLGGSDTLHGEGGNDRLVGGAGKDFLTGWAGTDYFMFAAPSDSGIGVAARDVIMDFQNGTDQIDLSFVDADTNSRGVDDAFLFIGNQTFSGVAGQLRVYAFADGQIVEGDVNGDAKADFSIEVAMNAFTTTLMSTDFVF
jgi:Ca2+-binding RTX toxin-like protein